MKSRYKSEAMNLRDWISQHVTLHRVVHATWCQFAGATFDRHRAVSTSGAGGGGGDRAPPPAPPPPPTPPPITDIPCFMSDILICQPQTGNLCTFDTVKNSQTGVAVYDGEFPCLTAKGYAWYLDYMGYYGVGHYVLTKWPC